MQIQGVIFDFDGVIAETESVHRQSWVELSNELSRPLPEGFLDRGIGSTLDKLAWELFEFWNGDVDLQEILDGKAEFFRSVLATHPDVLVNGVIDAIERFHEMQLPLGIATSSPYKEMEPLLNTHGIKSLFKSILTLDMVDKPKPDPEVYLKSADAIGIKPENCLVFEDSILGVTAATKAGMNVVGVLTSFKIDQLPPLIYSIDDFLDISTVIEKFSIQA